MADPFFTRDENHRRRRQIPEHQAVVIGPADQIHVGNVEGVGLIPKHRAQMGIAAQRRVVVQRRQRPVHAPPFGDRAHAGPQIFDELVLVLGADRADVHCEHGLPRDDVGRPRRQRDFANSPGDVVTGRGVGQLFEEERHFRRRHVGVPAVGHACAPSVGLDAVDLADHIGRRADAGDDPDRHPGLFQLVVLLDVQLETRVNRRLVGEGLIEILRRVA